MSRVIGKETKKVIDWVESRIRMLKSVKVAHVDGKTIVDTADNESLEKWKSLCAKPLNRFYVSKWIEGKTEEAFDTNRAEPFRSIIDDLSYLMVLAFGLNVSRFCIFHVDGDRYIRMSKGPHWHPRGDIFPLSGISNVVKRLLYGGESYIIIDDPINYDANDNLKKLIEMAGITSMEYCKVLDDWIFIVDTTGKKKGLTEGERKFFKLICEMMETIIIEGKKRHKSDKEREMEKTNALRVGQRRGLGYLGNMVSHHMVNGMTGIVGLAAMLKKNLEKIENGEHFEIEKIIKYVDSLEKDAAKIEKFISSLSVCATDFARSPKLEREDVQSIRLSDAITDAIRLIREKPEFKDRDIVFACNSMGANSVLADFDQVKTAIYRIMKKIFSSEGSRKVNSVNLVLEICKESAMIVFWHKDFDSESIKKLYEMEDKIYEHCEHEIDDLRLITSLEAMENQGVELQYDEKELVLIFKRH